MKYHSEIKDRAIQLRKNGHSLSEIAKRLNIGKSTASIWLKNVSLSSISQKKINNKIVIGRQKATRNISKAKETEIDSLKAEILNNLIKIRLTKDIKRLLCAVFLEIEDKMDNRNFILLNSSDPVKVSTFLKLFRASFSIDENKLRALVHIHSYHIDKDIKKYWSRITRIPLSRFNRSQRKSITKRRRREGYMGSISIRYYDSKVVLRLRIIYNMFAKLLGV